LTVTVKKLGGSVAVVIPKQVAQEFNLAAGASLEVSATGDAIVMRRAGQHRPRARRSIERIVAGIKPASYKRRQREMQGLRPVGKELW
jgi:AbrB family looped-hinge helix DNA binding protein